MISPREEKPAAAELGALTEEIRARVGHDCGLEAVLKFRFEEGGAVLIDGVSVPNVVSREDAPADCTVTLSRDTLRRMMAGEFDAGSAYRRGKLRLSGDVSVAFRISAVVQKRPPADAL
jgi:putative sterol carrier protein